MAISIDMQIIALMDKLFDQSIIACFEQNPAINGIPTSDILEINIEEVVVIEYVENWPYMRRS